MESIGILEHTQLQHIVTMASHSNGYPATSEIDSYVPTLGQSSTASNSTYNLNLRQPSTASDSTYNPTLRQPSTASDSTYNPTLRQPSTASNSTYDPTLRQSSTDSRPPLASSRWSSISDLSTPPTPLVNSTGYFGVADPSQIRERQYSDGSEYTVSPPSRPVSQFEPARRYSDGRDVIPEEVNISHVRMTESPAPEDTSYMWYTSTGPAPSQRSTGSIRSWGGLPWYPLDPYSPVMGEGTTPPTPTPVGRTGSSRAHRWLSKKSGRQTSFHNTIPEENDDAVELLPARAHGIPSASDGNGHIENTLGYDYAGVDLSSFSGPMAPHTEKQLMEANNLERNNILTGGLGTDVQPITFTTSALVASSPVDVVHRMRTRRGTRMSRSSTVRNLAQAEANRRGTPLAIQEEDPNDIVSIDVTAYDANGIHDFRLKGVRRAQPLIVYPTANWKPVTMRWPYLTSLIVMSIAMGIIQEWLYLKSERENGLLKFTDPKKIKTVDYFAFKYLGNILTVGYGILWQLTDAEVKRLEAYYQLGKEGGALAAESINIDYVTLFDIFRPFVALRFRHWAVAVSSFASILAVSVGPALQSATVDLNPNRGERDVDPTIEKTISIEMIWSRALTGAFFLIALLGLALLLMLQMRHSGLTVDVKGIAGVAALATRSHILPQFKDLDTVPPSDIHNKLKKKRYTLRNSSLAPDDNAEVTEAEADKFSAYNLSSNPHPFMMRWKSCLWLEIALFTFLAMIPILLFVDGAYIVSEKAPWLTTVLAVALKLVLQTLEQDVRMMEPFFILVNRHAPPKTLTLDYTGMATGYMPFRALWNRHFILASLGFGSVLSEVLTVCVGSLGTVSGTSFLGPAKHSNGQETPVSFWTSFILTMIILLYLMLTTSLVMIYRRNPFLPRQPSTIASVLAFVYQSKMLYGFVWDPGHSPGTMEEAIKKMVEKFEMEKKTFGYGWFTGRDGLDHCGVDWEELTQSYVLGTGMDRRKATMGKFEDVSMW